MGSVNRAAEAIMAALSVQRLSGAAAASGSEALSSEFAATPPTSAIGTLRRRLQTSAATNAASVRDIPLPARQMMILLESPHIQLLELPLAMRLCGPLCFLFR